MNRAYQIMLMVSCVGFSWLAMQAVHEAGHVLGGVVSGGRIARVILDPLDFSRTDLLHNPHPLLVAWAGPLVGVVLPLLAWIAARRCRLSAAYLLRFFAGFCLVANGGYIGYGSIEGLADAGDLLRHGAPRWQLLAFGLLCVGAGFYLWNGLGPNFGLGAAKGDVSRRMTVLLSICFLTLLAIELMLSTWLNAG